MEQRIKLPLVIRICGHMVVKLTVFYFHDCALQRDFRYCRFRDGNPATA